MRIGDRVKLFWEYGFWWLKGVEATIVSAYEDETTPFLKQCCPEVNHWVVQIAAPIKQPMAVSTGLPSGHIVVVEKWLKGDADAES